MIINDKNYRSFPAVSNSDLTSLQKYWEPEWLVIDKEKAYKFGTLIDAIITEPHKVDYFRFQVEGVQYSKEDFEQAQEMCKVFYRDEFCNKMVAQCSFQKISYQEKFKIQYGRFEFTLPAKCKWDLFCENFDLSGDIKSTAATTQKQFEEACYHFDYYRSRAWYMDLENRTNDILIGISKKNNKVFKIPMKKGDKLYNLGREQYQDLAFRHWSYFGEIA
ncbi:MAG: hypothetical protein WC756_12025 [Taibaiella sp.]|jgi:hypothetical protein